MSDDPKHAEQKAAKPRRELTLEQYRVTQPRGTQAPLNFHAGAND